MTTLAQKIYDTIAAHQPITAPNVARLIGVAKIQVATTIRYWQGRAWQQTGPRIEHSNGSVSWALEVTGQRPPTRSKRGQGRPSKDWTRRGSSESVEAVERQLLAIEAQQRRKRGLAA